MTCDLDKLFISLESMESYLFEIRKVMIETDSDNKILNGVFKDLALRIDSLEEKLKKLEQMMPYHVSAELDDLIKKDKVRVYIGLKINRDDD